LEYNIGCWNILKNNTETYCNYYLGLIKQDEIIALAVSVDHKRFGIINGDKAIHFDIEATCLDSKAKLSIKMIYSDFVG